MVKVRANLSGVIVMEAVKVDFTSKPVYVNGHNEQSVRATERAA